MRYLGVCVCTSVYTCTRFSNMNVRENSRTVEKACRVSGAQSQQHFYRSAGLHSAQGEGTRAPKVMSLRYSSTIRDHLGDK